MTSVRSGLWSVVVGASVLFGCGSDEPAGSYTLDEFKVALSEQTCVAWVSCGIYENIDQCTGVEYPFDKG